MNKEVYEAMKKACENFVNKVETGRTRSKESYKEMKEALELDNVRVFSVKDMDNAYDKGFKDGAGSMEY